jgi:hypothetical protein
MSNQKSSEITNQNNVVSQLILNGDLSKLAANDKVRYYNGYCERMGLDPFTKPFDILRLNGMEVLYCTRSGTQQLNKLHSVSHLITSRELIESVGVYQVTSKASLPDGRCTESIGAVNITGLKGEAYANAIMKAETKAKRRATLDLLGLGVLDESEAETIPNAEPASIALVQEPEEEIEPAEKTYPTLGTLLIALSKTQSVEEIKQLYFWNKDKVEHNAFVKEAFTNRKNEINNGK